MIIACIFVQKNARGVDQELVDKWADSYFCVSARVVFYYQQQ